MDGIFCFIKFLPQEFAEKLIHEGQLYFNLPSSFNNIAEQERGDENEGAEWIDNNRITEITAIHPTLGTFNLTPAPNSNSKIIQYKYYYLSYSLYAMTPELLGTLDDFKIDERMLEFGDTAVWINEPYIFLNSIIAELKRLNLKYEIQPVLYRNLSFGKVNLSHFDKKQEHRHQSEFRIVIENIDNLPRVIEIGSIEKYSRSVDAKIMIEMVWNAKRRISSS